MRYVFPIILPQSIVCIRCECVQVGKANPITSIYQIKSIFILCIGLSEIRHNWSVLNDDPVVYGEEWK